MYIVTPLSESPILIIMHTQLQLFSDLYNTIVTYKSDMIRMHTTYMLLMLSYAIVIGELKSKSASSSTFSNLKTAFSLHNLAIFAKHHLSSHC